MGNKTVIEAELRLDTTKAEEQGKRASKAIKSAYNVGNTGAMSQRTASQDSGMSRGIGGQTGAEGRDFAKQAQGMGGLVHIYATFAANIFALSAAFTALSKAADTTNMIKGLDQLGAASGRALGSLSKQLVTATDGAISLRDAMTATALASSGGMTNSAILRMGEVARQASQALGVGMPDAISRLSRGITKLEPELLDELGIMVRVDRTSQEYAASIGKSAAALTDFEKRQAFANAVLEQGEKKFGAIKIDANPYAKILASMENLAQQGLEIVNKVLNPILTILSSSPTALALAMAGVASILLKQALPAIGAFRKSLDDSAKIAKEFAVNRATEARKGYEEAFKNAKNAASIKAKAEFDIAKQAADDLAQEKVSRVEATEAKLKKLRESSTKGTATYDILSKKELGDITEADLKRLDDNAAQAAGRKDKQGAKTAALQREYAKNIREWKAEELAYEKSVIEAQAKKDAALAKYNKSAEQAAREQIAKQGVLSTIKHNQIIADRAVLASTSKSIVATAANEAATKGLGIAWKEALASVNTAKAEQGMGKLQGMWTMTKVGIVGATGAISTFMNFMGPWIAVIGMAMAGISALVSYMSTSEKETEKLAGSLTRLDDAGKNVSNTLDNISEKSFSETLDPKAIQARATAFLEVADAINSAAQSYRNLINAQSRSDKAVESVFSFFGKGESDKLAKTLGSTLTSSLELLADNPEVRKSATEAISSLLGGVDANSQKAITKAFKEVSPDDLAQLGTSINSIFKKASQEVNNTASRLTSFVDGLTGINKLVTETNAKLVPQDENSKLGAALVAQSISLAQVLEEGPIKSLAALNSLINDSKSLSLLPEGTQNQLIARSSELKKIQEQLGENAKLELQAERSLAEARNLKDTAIKEERVETLDQLTGLDNSIASSQKTLDKIREARVALEKTAVEVVETASSGVTKGIFEAGADRLTKSLDAGLTAAAVSAGNAFLSAIKGLGADTAILESKQKDMELASQRSLVEATYANVKSQAELTLRIREATVQEKISSAESALRASTTPQGRESNITRLAAAKKEESSLVAERKIVEGNPRDTLNQLKDKTKLSQEERDALSAQSGFLQTMLGYRVQMAALDAKAYENRVTKIVNLGKEELNSTLRNLENDKKDLVITKSKIDLAKTLTSTYDEGLSLAALEVDKSIAFNESLVNREKILSDISILNKLIDTTEDKEKKAKGVEARDRAITALSKENDTARQKQIDLDTKASNDKIAGEKALAATKRGYAEIERNNAKDLAMLNIENSERDLKYMKDIGAITAEQAALSSAQLLLDKQALDYSTQRASVAELERLSKEKTAELDRQKAANASGTVPQIDIAPAQAAAASALANYTAQKSAVDSRNTSIVTGITLTSQHEQLLAKQNERLQEAQSLTESLTTLFGELGTNLGKVGESFANVAKSMEDLAVRKKSLDDRKVDVNADEYKKYEKDKTKAELNNISTVANATKKLFHEKTVSHKVLDGMEKAAHAWRIASTVQETAAKIGGAIQAMGINSLADAKAAISKIPGVLMSFVQSMGWPGVAAGAAFVASLGLGGSGGGDASIGRTAEDMQKTQGTGTVYGDSTAKSNSIANSLSLLTATSIEGLSYSNESVTLLENINLGIGKVSDALAGVDGVTTGTIKGIVEGSTSSGGGLLSMLFGGSSSSTSVIDSGVRLRGTFLDLANAVEGSIKQYNTVATTSSSSGGLLSSVFGGGGSSSTAVSEVNAALPKTILENISGVFSAGRSVFIQQASEISGSMTPSIVDSVLGTLDISGLVSLRGLKGTALKEEFNSAISAIMDSAAAGLFPQLNKFRKVGEGMSETVTRVLDGNDKVMLSFTSIGKSYTELPETFAAVPKEIKDNYEKAQRDLETAQKGEMQSVITGYTQGEGEYFTQYAEQLVVDQDKVTASTIALQAATALYNTAVNASTTNNIDVTNALIENAGGLDKYLENIKFFGDNFLTEAERLKPIAEKVNSTLGSILSGSLDKLVGPRLPGDSSKGYASDLMKDVSDGKNGVIDTREEFKRLYLAVDVTKEEGRELIKALDDIAPSFDKTATAAENMTKAKLGQYVQILELLGDKETALAVTRQQELDAMDEALRPAQKYIYALQDRAKAETKVKAIYDKTTNSIKNTTSQIKSLDDAINSLKLGQQSVLTPDQKYAEAKSQVDALQRAIANTGTDTASVEAKNEALSKLPSATASFLDASKVLFASGTQYTQDFNSVLGILSSNKTALESQRTLEQQTVDNLKSSNSYLASIEYSLADLPQALRELAAANGAVATAGAGVFDPGRAKSIRDYVHTLEWGNPATEANSARSVYGAAQQYGVTQAEIASAMNLPYKDIVEFFAKYGIPAFAKGGLASGLSLVGEQGPELVDFRSPGRVYSAESSNDMFANSNKELVAEVRALRAEVTKLREEQKEQTGHLITTNYDANARAAGAVAGSVETSTTNANWATRSQAKIA